MISLAVMLLASVFSRQGYRVASMDPAQCQSVYDSMAIQLVYETPLTIDYYARPYKLVPGACEMPEVSADGLTYVFRMRSDAVSSHDLVRSLERLRDPGLVSPNGWYLKCVDTIKALDDRTVEIRMKRRQHVFPWIMAMSGCGIMKPDGSGTGPFILSKWWKNHEMVFTRRVSSPIVSRASSRVSSPIVSRASSRVLSPIVSRASSRVSSPIVSRASSRVSSPIVPRASSRVLSPIVSRASSRASSPIVSRASSRGAPFDEVRYLVVDDMSTQWLMFLNGELDMLGEISQDNWDAVVDKDGKLSPDLVRQGVKMHTMPTLQTMYVGINMKDPVLGPNKKLRQALNAAFDFEAWNRFYCNRAVEAGGPLPPTVEAALPAETFKYRFNLELAKRLMAEAGYPDGIDPKTGRRLVLTLSMGRASQDARERAELMASFYAKIGVKLETQFYTWEAFLKAVNEGRTQMFNLGWVGDYPDAENFLQLFHSSNVSPGANHGFYVNPEFDRAYDAAMAATTETDRNRHWRECQEIVREDCPWIFTHVPMSNSLVRPTVGNYIPSDFPYGQEVHLRFCGTDVPAR